VETGEGDHVDGELSEVRVELTRETETGRDARHDNRDKVVEVAVGRGGELERTEADVIEGLVVNAEGLVRVLDELVHGEGGVVRLNDGIGDLRMSAGGCISSEMTIGDMMGALAYLGRGNNRESAHHAVGELLADLGDEQGTHTGTGTTTERVGDLEALEGVTALGFATDDVEDGVNELRTLVMSTRSVVGGTRRTSLLTLSVVALGPIVTSTALAENAIGVSTIPDTDLGNGDHKRMHGLTSCQVGRESRGDHRGSSP
jgi:hypothetical protein